jgi:hypothetical protein
LSNAKLESFWVKERLIIQVLKTHKFRLKKNINKKHKGKPVTLYSSNNRYYWDADKRTINRLLKKAGYVKVQ